MLSPFLLKYDKSTTNKGSLDPLGLYQISVQFAIKLIPGFREQYGIQDIRQLSLQE